MTAFLEELKAAYKGFNYESKKIGMAKNEQKEEWFLKVRIGSTPLHSILASVLELVLVLVLVELYFSLRCATLTNLIRIFGRSARDRSTPTEGFLLLSTLTVVTVGIRYTLI